MFDDRHVRDVKDLCCTVLLMFYLRTGDPDSLRPLMDVPPFHLIHIDMFNDKAFLKSVFSEYSRMDRVAVCTLLKCQMKAGMYGLYVQFDMNSLLDKIDRKERQNATVTKNILKLVSQMNIYDLYSYGHTLHSLIDLQLPNFNYADVIGLLIVAIAATIQTEDSDIFKTTLTTIKFDGTISGQDTVALIDKIVGIHDEVDDIQDVLDRKQLIAIYVTICKHLITSPLTTRLTGVEAAMVVCKCLRLHGVNSIFPRIHANSLLEYVLPVDITLEYSRQFLSTFLGNCNSWLFDVKNTILLLESVLPSFALRLLEEDVIVSVLSEIISKTTDAIINIDLVDAYSDFCKTVIVLMEYLLYSNIRRSGKFAHIYTFQCDTSAPSVYTGDTYRVTIKYASKIIITCGVDITNREKASVIIQPNIVDFRDVFDCVSHEIPALCLFLLNMGNIKSDTHQFQSMIDIFRFLLTTKRYASSPLVYTTEHYTVTCTLTDILLWHIEYNIIHVNEDIDESLFCSVFGEGPQHDDSSRNWCRECLFEIVDCSCINTDDIWEIYQLLRIISSNEVRPDRRFTILKDKDKLDISTIHTMVIVKELSNSEIVSIIQTLMKMSNHSFLLSLLSSDALRHITNEKFLDIVADSEQEDFEYIDECSLFRNTLRVVDELSDVGSDDTDCNRECCEKCVKSVLQSPAITSAPRETCLYIIKGIMQSDLLCDYATDVIESTICTKLDEYDMVNIFKKSIQSGELAKSRNHAYLLPLLASSTWRFITNGKILDIITASRQDYGIYGTPCMFSCILRFVDELIEVSCDDAECHGKLCVDCVKSVLQSPAVKSASRGTCLYLIKGIIQNRIVSVMDILIQSPVCRRVKMNEILNIIKESKNYMFCKLFLQKLSLSEDEVLNCIRQFICMGEKIHTEESCYIEPGEDLITTTLNSQRANITSGKKFYEIIKTIISHESNWTYKHVQCVLSNPAASTLTTDMVGELLAESFHQHESGMNTKDTKVAYLELKDSCTSLLLSVFIKRAYDDRTQSLARIFITDVRNDKQYILLINGCSLFLARISLDDESKPSLFITSLLTDCSEDETMKALINVLSLECNADKMLRMLLDSLSINLCVENVEILLAAVMDKELNVLKRRDLINEFEQPTTTNIRTQSYVR